MDNISSLPKDTWLNVYKPDIDTCLLMDVLSNEKYRIVSAHVNKVFPIVQTFGADINPCAIDFIRKVHPNGNIIKTLLLSSIRDESVDLFVYNPSYVPTPQEELNHSYITLSWAGGIDGCEKIDCVIEKIWDILSPNGVACVILIQDNNLAGVMKNAVAHGLIPKIIDSCKLEREVACYTIYSFMHNRMMVVEDCYFIN
ncbi:N6-DNA-methyltransferase [Entamoeba marina]